MSENKFTSILSKAKVGEIEKPKPLPEGGYIAIIKSTTFGESSTKKTPFVRVNMELVAPMDDVDQDALQAMGGLKNNKVRTDFYLTDEAMFRLQDFIIEHVGLDLAGMSFDQAIPQLTNNQVGVRLKQIVSENDPSEMYSVVDKTFNPNA